MDKRSAERWDFVCYCGYVRKKIIGLVLILLALGGYYYAQNLIPSGWGKYTDEIYGFSFFVPGDWGAFEAPFTGYEKFVSFRPEDDRVILSYFVGDGKLSPYKNPDSKSKCGTLVYKIKSINITKDTWCEENIKTIHITFDTSTPFKLHFDIYGKDNFKLEQEIFDKVISSVVLPE